MSVEIIQQEDDCAFYRVEGEYGIYWEPIDPHAIYGYLHSGDRGDDAGTLDIPVRQFSRSLVTAIREVKPGDRVRVNNNNWMVAVEPDNGFVDEGFAARYENGSVVYAVRVNDYGGQGYSEHRMRRWDDFSSQGIVSCLEVDWNPEVHPTLEDE